MSPIPDKEESDIKREREKDCMSSCNYWSEKQIICHTGGEQLKKLPKKVVEVVPLREFKEGLVNIWLSVFGEDSI